jgi:hypothetical protein
MLIRKTVLALALAGAAVPAAFANGGYERPFESSASASTKSRSDVQKELEAFRRNPAGAGGSVLSDRDARFITPQHSYGFQNGTLVHTDNIPHNTPMPARLAMTDAERSLYRNN